MAPKVTLYALSTCGWCRKTERFLKSNDIEYECFYVDRLEDSEKDAALANLLQLNPRRTFPTLSIGGEVVIGFDEERIVELLGL